MTWEALQKFRADVLKELTMDSISGSVWAVIYSAENYSVWEIKQGAKHVKVTLQQSYKDPVGLKFRFDGEWRDHPKYGKQFKVVAIQLLTSESPTEEALRALLPEIGYVRSKKLAKKFGDKIWEVVASDPLKMVCIEGITEARALAIQRAYHSSQTVDIARQLFEIGLDEFVVKRMIGAWKGDALETFQNDPYSLIELRGIGFPKADYYAQKAGKISLYDERRIKAGLTHILQENEFSGSTVIYAAKWLTDTAKLLGVEKGRVFNVAKVLKESEAVVVIENNSKQMVASPGMNYAETGLADILKMLVEEGRLTVITGPPGTGKTFSAVQKINKLASQGEIIGVCAPTGKAAQRFSELGSVPASTIHRLLRVDRHGDFYYNEDNPLPSDLIVVDESSMVDTKLCYALFSAIDNKADTLLVGDPWQLPSVGAGKILYDIMNVYPEIVTRLSKVWRSTTSIPVHCQSILKGEMPEFDNFLPFIQADSPKEVVEIVAELKPDIILSPRKRAHDFACDNLNGLLQEKFNKDGHSVNHKFRIGDPVVQTMNDYERQVFNGEVGIVLEKKENKFVVKHYFPKRNIEYPLTYPDIELAYALTVHKSQGSEWDNVAVILHPSMGWMLRRDLVYTAVSRAKKRCFIIGSKRAFRKAIEVNEPEVERRLTLLPLLTEDYNEAK